MGCLWKRTVVTQWILSPQEDSVIHLELKLERLSKLRIHPHGDVLAKRYLRIYCKWY